MADGVTFPFLRQVGSLWTSEEDLVLLRHVAVHGTKYWGFLQASGTLPHRDQKACCNRFILLKKRHFLERGKNIPRGQNRALSSRDDRAIASSVLQLPRDSLSSLANDSQSARSPRDLSRDLSHAAATAATPSAIGSATTTAMATAAAGVANGESQASACRTDSAAHSSQRLMSWAATAGRKLQGELKRCREESAAAASAAAAAAAAAATAAAAGVRTQMMADEGVTAATQRFLPGGRFEANRDDHVDSAWTRSVKPRVDAASNAQAFPASIASASRVLPPPSGALPNASAAAAAASADLDLAVRLFPSIRAFLGAGSRTVLAGPESAADTVVAGSSSSVAAAAAAAAASMASAPSAFFADPREARVPSSPSSSPLQAAAADATVASASRAAFAQAQRPPAQLAASPFPASSAILRHLLCSHSQSSVALSSSAHGRATLAAAASASASPYAAAAASSRPGVPGPVASPCASSASPSLAPTSFSLSHSVASAGLTGPARSGAQGKKWGYSASGEVDREEACMAQCVPGERASGWNMQEQVVPRSTLARSRLAHSPMDRATAAAGGFTVGAGAAAGVTNNTAAATAAGGGAAGAPCPRAAALASVLRTRLPGYSPSPVPFASTLAYSPAAPAALAGGSRFASAPSAIPAAAAAAPGAMASAQEGAERKAMRMLTPSNPAAGGVMAERSKEEGVFGWMYGGGAGPEHLQALLGSMARRVSEEQGHGVEAKDESLTGIILPDSGVVSPDTDAPGGGGGAAAEYGAAAVASVAAGAAASVGAGKSTGVTGEGQGDSDVLLDAMLDGLCDLLVPDWQPSASAALPPVAGSDAAAAYTPAAAPAETAAAAGGTAGVVAPSEVPADQEQLQFVAALFEQHQQGQEPQEEVLAVAWEHGMQKEREWMPSAEAFKHTFVDPSDPYLLMQSPPPSVSSLLTVPERPSLASRRVPRFLAGTVDHSCVVPKSLPSAASNAEVGKIVDGDLFGKDFYARPDMVLERMAAGRTHHL